MTKRREPSESSDFVKWLASQLKAFRARRFAELDVEAVGCELEAVVGRYRSEVRHRAERLIPILLKPSYVYGDWNDLRFQSDMLRSALEDSPSLVERANADIKGAYRSAWLKAELHGEGGGPKQCPWKTLEDFLAAVEGRDGEYLALERERNSGACAAISRRIHHRTARRRRNRRASGKATVAT